MPSVTEKWDGQAGESRGQGRLSSRASMRPVVLQKPCCKKPNRKCLRSTQRLDFGKCKKTSFSKKPHGDELSWLSLQEL